MATKVHMEALSPTMEEGQIVQWLKNEGDQIAEGDLIAEIETDKATMELVARGSGILRKILLPAGTAAPVGSVIAVIAAADEDVSSLTGDAGGDAPKAEPVQASDGSARAVEEDMERTSQTSDDAGGALPAEEAGSDGEALAAAGEADGAAEPKAKETTGEAPSAAPKTGAPMKPTAGSAPAKPAAGGARPPSTAPDRASAEDAGARPAERVKATPLARRLAADSGVELSSVEGSGPGGRIIRRDVEAASSQPAAATAAGSATRAVSASPSAPGAKAAARADVPEVEEIRVSQMRKTIAKRLVESIGPVPTFYLTIEVDMTRMMSMRESMNERLADSGVKISVNDLIIKATATALRRHPEVNAAWGGDVIRRYGRVHIGVAVAVEDGLITPIVRDADTKGAAEIAQQVRELAGRAREKKLQPDEYTGATFSISNLGMFGIDEFTAIINPPEAAILAVGRVEEKPVFVGGRLVPQPRMRITMSCDHRVIDGAMGAKFLQTLRSFLEEPMMMIA